MPIREHRDFEHFKTMQGEFREKYDIAKQRSDQRRRDNRERKKQNAKAKLKSLFSRQP